ncbi:sensor histidine kinase [Actinopolymorpha alba]|uniref:sensor histidine kinase n=1 Tax=Actinopolymorpha alba TaxID=533267 RepID=UPI00035CC09D|nr:sensor histidine kinase [Actinopolymorpha alba]
MTSTVATAAAARRGFFGRLGARSGYVLTELPIAIARFVVLLPMFLLGIATAVTVIGLPILATALRVARGFAYIDRIRLSNAQGWPARRPVYRGRPGKTWFGRAIAPIRQGQCWADWGHGVLGFIPALVGFVFTVTWWAAALGGLLTFTWLWAIPRDPGDQQLAGLLGLGDSYQAELIVQTAVGAVFALTLPAVVKATAGLNTSLARFMLTSDRVTELHGQVSDLTESRDAAVSAEASALRRLERDIHDGPQQRLVRLAMDLSSAQRRLTKDPNAVQPMLAEAIAQTRETLDELRALSRGIAPPILADRGLRAALAAVAGRSMVPVDLNVDIADGVRFPAVVENAAYFLVAEALTNVAKHSGATQCSVDVSQETRGEQTLARVIVSDNGIGGAHTAKGHGLAGLADRVRATGGQFAVSSPVGGPTILMAELPCGS